MKCLIDAQLPRKMVDWLANGGCDAVHTLDLPDENRTTDAEIIAMADPEERIVVTKDDDFVDTHILQGRPAKLLLVSTGNISNRELESLMAPLIPDLILAFQAHSFVELSRTGIIVRS